MRTLLLNLIALSAASQASAQGSLHGNERVLYSQSSDDLIGIAIGYFTAPDVKEFLKEPGDIQCPTFNQCFLWFDRTGKLVSPPPPSGVYRSHHPYSQRFNGLDASPSREERGSPKLLTLTFFHAEEIYDFLDKGKPLKRKGDEFMGHEIECYFTTYMRPYAEAICEIRMSELGLVPTEAAEGMKQ